MRRTMDPGGARTSPGGGSSTFAESWRLGPSEVIALVGAGGKSSLMEALARDYEAEGARVLLTTTTKVRPPRPGGRTLVLAETLQELVSKVSRALSAGGSGSPAPLVGRRLLPEHKVEGIPPQWVRVLRDLPGVDGVVVEADGAAGRPLKAPAPWEPVVPSCASLVVAVAGLDAQGAPLDEAHVHRAGMASEMLGLEEGAPVVARLVLALSVSAYVDRAPKGADFLVFLNKSDVAVPAPDLLEACRDEGVAVWSGSAAAAIGEVGRSADEDTGTAGLRCLRAVDTRPAAIVLAAGRASRMGGPKLLAPLGEGTVLGHVLGAVGSRIDRFSQVVVVAGVDSEDVSATVGPFAVATNLDPGAGQSTSLRTGIEALDAVRDIVVLLGDQPFVTRDTLDRLLAAREAAPRAAAVALSPEGRGAGGPPVVFHRSLIPQMLELRGDEGARGLLGRYRRGVVDVPATALEGLDVDTPDALARARREVEGGLGDRSPGGRPNGPADGGR